MASKGPAETSDSFSAGDPLLGVIERNAAISWPVPLHQLLDDLATDYYERYGIILPRKMILAAILYDRRSVSPPQLKGMVDALAEATVAKALRTPGRKGRIDIQRKKPGPRVPRGVAKASSKPKAS